MPALHKILWSAFIRSPCCKRVSTRTAQAGFVSQTRWTMELQRGIIAKDYNLLSLGETVSMTRCTRWLRSLLSFACLFFTLMCDMGRWLLLCLCPSPALAAEIGAHPLLLWKRKKAKLPISMDSITTRSEVWPCDNPRTGVNRAPTRTVLIIG